MLFNKDLLHKFVFLMRWTMMKRPIYDTHAILYSLEFASPTILSILRSSLNLSRTVPLTASCLSCVASWVTPQHSITSGNIRLVLERQGLPNVVHENVCPWSKFADTNKPKWLTRPPKPMPFGMSSEVKLIAHYNTYFQELNKNM